VGNGNNPDVACAKGEFCEPDIVSRSSPIFIKYLCEFNSMCVFLKNILDILPKNVNSNTVEFKS
jgi:hypothetical protein